LGRHFAAAALLLASASAALGAEPAPALTIGAITVETNEVFNTAVYPESKLLYRMANGLHWRTRENVIRKELLFETGQPYDPALLAETERNLRALPFIRRAEVQAVRASSSTVDVVVRTYDAWSLEITSSYSHAGGQSTWKAGAAERNVAGEGKSVGGTYTHAGTAQNTDFSYEDPQFLTRWLDYSMSVVTIPGSQIFSASLIRPFYASIAGFSLGLSADYRDQEVTNYSAQTSLGQIRRHAADVGLNYGVALATSTHHTRRLKAGIMRQTMDFDSIDGMPFAGVPPANEQLTSFQLGAEWEALDYIKERRINRFSHEEDFNLGFGVIPNVSWAPRAAALASGGSQVMPGVTLRKGYRTEPGGLLLLNGGYSSSYFTGANSSRLVSANVAYFHRIPNQTLAAHLQYVHAWKLDPAAPLTLGDANGLRGYGLAQFSGTRRAVINLEDRIFILDELWKLLDVGAVAFFDTGYAWPSGCREGMLDLKSSVGIGLRLAPSRSSTNQPVRFDLAYALNDNQSRTRWSVSVLAGQTFGYNPE